MRKKSNFHPCRDMFNFLQTSALNLLMRNLKRTDYLRLLDRSILSMLKSTARTLLMFLMKILKKFNFSFKICCWKIRLGHIDNQKYYSVHRSKNKVKNIRTSWVSVLLVDLRLNRTWLLTRDLFKCDEVTTAGSQIKNPKTH